ncbi:MAG TPA: lysophospholipid acyltransferase family protein, partial [Nannocystaceae bacterium]|nr:lysophospholipid acyltransferase family protein [Nannocystaceae bacterium]
MPHAVRVLIVGMFYAAFGVFGLLLTFVFVQLAIRGVRDREARIARGQDLVQRWSRRYFDWLTRFRICRPHWPRRPPAVLAQGRPAVVIANHPSLLDVVFLMGALPRITYVAKESWVNGPLGSMLRSCGHIGLPASRSPADGAIALQRMIDALTAGRTLLVFPEGTRSPMHGLYPFQRGAFEAAIRVGVPIVRLVVRVEPSMLRKHQPWYDVARRPVDFTVD